MWHFVTGCRSALISYPVSIPQPLWDEDDDDDF